MTRILIADSNTSHANDIKTAIANAYGGGGLDPIADQMQVMSTWEAAVAEAESNENIVALLRSYTGVEQIVSDAEALYPRVQCFFPLGSNSFVQLNNLTEIPVVVTSGAGDTQYENKNNTGYGLGLEFWDNDLVQSADGDASSFANGYILGKLLKIKDELSCSWWEARYRARMTADRNESNRQTSPWDLYNGYGIINADAATAYSDAIVEDPYLYWNSVSSVDFGAVRPGQSVTRQFQSNRIWENTDNLSFVSSGNNITVTFLASEEQSFSEEIAGVVFTAQVSDIRDFTYTDNNYNVQVTFTIHYH